MVSTEHKLIAAFALLALLGGTFVASVPGLPDWAGPAVVLVVGVVFPQVWFGYREFGTEEA